MSKLESSNKMDKISTSELLAYTNVLENIVESNNMVVRESNSAILNNFGKKSDFEVVALKAVNLSNEAHKTLEKIQKVIDQRMNKNIGFMGIRQTQKVIEDFHKIVEKLQKENAEIDKKPKLTVSK